jgi:anti-sigma factor RsiW
VSEPERTPDCERLDVAAYVLGALEQSELDNYLAHLDDCAQCRDEVLQLQSAVDSLALAVPRWQAPESMRARVMATVHAEAELLRAAGHEADRPPPVRARRLRWSLNPSFAAAAAGVLAVGVLIGALVFASGSSHRVRVIQATVLVPGHRATAALQVADESHVQLVVKNMPTPPRGRIYEVWFARGTQPPEPTDARFSVTRQGESSIAIPGNLNGVSKVLVTDEPLGGSLKPTRAPVIVAQV